jgi:activator of 2-hydroxyglutaryl-CoA dehydratase
MMLLADCGTQWSKVRDSRELTPRIVETRVLLGESELHFDLATGHLAKARTDRYENELVALAFGSLALVAEEDFVVVDVGARDTKYCAFRGRQLTDMDWNQSCGATTGFTLDLLGRYYDLDYAILEPADRALNVTCGVFGIERIFDAVIQGGTPEEAVAGFVRGVAHNIHSFVGGPARLYLSGGLCLNRCFLRSLALYAEVIPLGREVLLRGLQTLAGS